MRPAFTQPERVSLTNSCPLRLPISLEVKYKGEDMQAVYLGHGGSRTVYTLSHRNCEAALKLAGTVEANAREIAAFSLLAASGLSPRIYDHGDVGFWGRGGEPQNCLHGILVEKAPETLEQALRRSPSSQLVLECAKALVRCNALGVVVTDVHPGNWGVLSGGKVCLLDVGWRNQMDPLSKSELNAKAMRRLWERIGKVAPEEVIAPVRELWTGSRDVGSFLASSIAPRTLLVRDPWAEAVDRVRISDTAASASIESNSVFVAKLGWFVNSLEVRCGGEVNRCGGNSGTSELTTELLSGEWATGVCIYRHRGDEPGVLARKIVIKTNKRNIVFEGTSRHGSFTDMYDLQVAPEETFAGLIVTTRGPALLCRPTIERTIFPSVSERAVVVSDSTIGFILCKGSSCEMHDAERATMLLQCGGCWSGHLGPFVAELLGGRRFRRVLYVPMKDSLPPEQQVKYRDAELAQEDAFRGRPFVELPSVNSLCAGYEQVHWTEFRDPSSQPYNSKSKLHLREGPAKYMLRRLLSLVEPGDFVMVVGWNATDYRREFREQAVFGQMVLGVNV